MLGTIALMKRRADRPSGVRSPMFALLFAPAVASAQVEVRLNEGSVYVVGPRGLVVSMMCSSGCSTSAPALAPGRYRVSTELGGDRWAFEARGDEVLIDVRTRGDALGDVRIERAPREVVVRATGPRELGLLRPEHPRSSDLRRLVWCTPGGAARALAERALGPRPVGADGRALR